MLVAREAATVDLLTDGRLQLGLGAGYMRSEYEQAGLAYDPGRTRVERLAEAVAIIKPLLAGETVSGRPESSPRPVGHLQLRHPRAVSGRAGARDRAAGRRVGTGDPGVMADAKRHDA